MTDLDPPEPLETTVGEYVSVAVPLPVPGSFTYRMPSGIEVPLPGARVLAPFGPKRLVGVSLGPASTPEPGQSIKEIIEVLDEEPVLSDALLQLARWVSDYYLAPMGEAVRSMLPPGLMVRSARQSKREFWPSRRVAAVTSHSDTSEDLTPRQAEVFSHILEARLPIPVQKLCRAAGCSPSLIHTLHRKGVVTVQDVDVYRSPWHSSEAVTAAEKHSLNSHQQEALDAIAARVDAHQFAGVLLHGVTGSGKTEVYLNAIERTLQTGRTALMLVPEIGLTPQVSRAFRSWFGDRVAILHSALSKGERFDQWRRIRQGETPVVVGTRSAVFAPLSDLGLILVDEEHDNSYKQEETPRYNGRDTALRRGQIESVPVVMGSATPQIEVYHRATEHKKFTYLNLPTRILDRPLPTVHIVDMRVEFERHGKSQLFSDLLLSSIEERLKRGHQSLILLNRRGYSHSILCRSCGHTENCPHCSVTLTFHRSFSRLVCHYCGYGRSVPRVCPDCSKEFLHRVGEGTEKIEESLRARFEGAVIERLDRDSIQRKGSLQEILRRFSKGEIEVLVGTQIIAKGHDFPGVTLVGVLSADQGLRLADFRAAERTFQLLTQVAGRSGRCQDRGDVVVQTYFPNYYSLKYACAQDYTMFYRREIEFRRSFRYPPFTALANLVISGEKEDEIFEFSESLVADLGKLRDAHSSPSRMRVLGPAPAPIERIRGNYRFQIVIKTTSRVELRAVLNEALAATGSKRKLIAVDIDPVSLL